MTEKLIKNNLVLELHVPSFAPVREFYGKFGFCELDYDPTSGGGSDMGYLTISRTDKFGMTMLNFYGDKDKVAKHGHFGDFPPDTPRGYAVEITVPVFAIDELWQKIKDDKEVKISQDLVTKRWGKRDFRVVDPFGFYVRFTELVDWGQK
ncbi:hypothetical protein FWG95_01730 [Candidatus Saccharibacteria bacterium]|nr:hypothetical protein [Candidatus Saccharibacteria bacterium]